MYTLKTFTPETLQSSPHLHPLYEMINNGFINHRKDFLDLSKIHNRFETPQEIIDQLSSSGLGCALFDTQDGEDVPVAYAAVKPLYQEPLVEGGDLDSFTATVPKAEPTLPEERLPWYRVKHWELCSVVVHDDPKYARQGLAAQCCAGVEAALVERIRESEHEMESMTVWIRAIKELNGEYWVRRGYREVGGRRCEPGEWGAKRAFDLAFGRKELVI